MSELNISDTQLQKDLSLYSSIVSEWKNGSSKSYKKHLPQISQYLDVSADYLLGKTSIKKEPSPERQAKADYLAQLLIERGVIPEDYSTDDLKRVADIFAAAAPLVKKVLDDNK
jgi:transcriptional regulator with XRE-family HTH domain